MVSSILIKYLKNLHTIIQFQATTFNNNNNHLFAKSYIVTSIPYNSNSFQTDLFKQIYSNRSIGIIC